MLGTKCTKLSSLGLLWLRVLMGSSIAVHGYQKIFGGGVETFASFVETLGLPFPLAAAWVAALSEFVGGILIVLGLGTRFAALLIFGTMTVAAFVAHASDPFSTKELALAFWQSECHWWKKH